MKLKIDVELDWIGDHEQGIHPDSEIKDAIVLAIADKISLGFKNQVNMEVSKLLESRLSATIDETVNNFLEQPVVITDRYGDTKERYESVREMLKESFDNFLNQKVDKYGKPTTSCSYGGDSTRINYLINTRVHGAAENFMKTVTGRVDQQLKKSLDETVKHKVSDAIMKRLDIDVAQMVTQ